VKVMAKIPMMIESGTGPSSPPGPSTTTKLQAIAANTPKNTARPPRYAIGYLCSFRA